jgi:hypothetical protein
MVGTHERLGLRLGASGANPGFRAGIAVFPEARVTATIVSNAWGRGAASAELVVDVVDRLAVQAAG